jgi:hypothetical protein
VSEPTTDAQLDGFLEIRKPGAHLDEEAVADDFVLMLGVDLTNFPRFPRVDDNVTYKRADLDIRQELDVDSGAELPDYAGPYRPDLRFTGLLPAGARHPVPALERGVPAAVRRRLGRRGAKRYGAETMAEIEWAAWNDQVVARDRAHEGRVPAGRPRSYEDPNQRVAEADRPRPGSSTPGCSRPAPTRASSPRSSW